MSMGFGMAPTPAYCPPGMGLDPGRMHMPAMGSWQQYLTSLFRLVESSLAYDQLLHSFHVQAAQQPQIAREPALEKFDRYAVELLHAKVTMAGLIRRALLGELGPEIMRDLTRQAHLMNKAAEHMLHTFRELQKKTEVMELMPMRGIAWVMGQWQPMHRSIMHWTHGIMAPMMGPDPHGMPGASPEEAH